MTTIREKGCIGFVAALAFLFAAVPPTAARDEETPKRGGTMRFVAGAGSGTLDPHVNFTMQYFQMNYALYDGLLGFKKADGKAGNEVVPDLAVALPELKDDARTLVFTLRNGVKFSNGATVTVDDVAASFKRIFKVRSPVAASFFGTLVGADKCLASPDDCELTGGVETDPTHRTVTLHLTRPDFEMEQKLSLPLAAVLPAGAPPTDAGASPIPGTGPYMVESADPKRGLRLVRNPHFKEFSADAQPDGWVDAINYDFGLSEDEQIEAIGKGRADWTFDAVPADRLSELAIRYSKRLRVRPLQSMWYLAMNTRLPPFNDIRARQAVNYAVDRYAAVKTVGGINFGAPTCQILPPGMTAYEPYCPYTAGSGPTWRRPDMAKARDLVDASGTAGADVEIVVKDAPTNRAIGELVAESLRKIGYSATVKAMRKDQQPAYIQNTDNNVRMSLSIWTQDYPAPSDFLNVLFSCSSFHPSSDNSINISGFCDKDIDAAMEEALRLGSTDPARADKMWADIDKQITDKAPIAPLFNPKQITFLSARVRNFEFNDQMNWLFTKAWVE